MSAMPHLSPNTNRQLNRGSIQTVDLTDPNDPQELSPASQTSISDSSSPMAPHSATTSQRSGGRKRNASLVEGDSPIAHGSATAGPSKRQRRRVAEEEESGDGDLSVAVDDVGDQDALDAALRKQREEQVKAQASGDNAPSKLSQLQCVICMEPFTDITATSCGHLFCHECLMSALQASEVRRQQAVGGQGKKSQCPVCRKSLDRSKKGDIIPLLIMKQGPSTRTRLR